VSQPDRNGFSDSMAITAGLAAIALLTMPSAVSNADKRTVTVEVAFVDRAEIDRKPEPTDAAGLDGTPAVPPGTEQMPAPITRFNVVTTPGRPLTVHIDPADPGSGTLPAGLVCSFGTRRGVACDAAALTVTATAETEFRLDRSPADSNEPGIAGQPLTALEVTIAYQ